MQALCKVIEFQWPKGSVRLYLKAHVRGCLRLRTHGLALCPVFARLANWAATADHGLHKHALGVLPPVQAL